MPRKIWWIVFTIFGLLNLFLDEDSFPDLNFFFMVPMQKALPDFEIKPYLLLVNKDAVASRDGLNQLFKVKKDAKGRTEVMVSEGLTSAQIGNFDLLREVPMGEIVQRLHPHSIRILERAHSIEKGSKEKHPMKC